MSAAVSSTSRAPAAPADRSRAETSMRDHEKPNDGHKKAKGEMTISESSFQLIRGSNSI
ncbi:MAG: hypothetical protein K6F13_03145 [Lachnospiraceae bacterium]|nr:hypothetical protein [Lachnospiraceae bacterium]